MRGRRSAERPDGVGRHVRAHGVLHEFYMIGFSLQHTYTCWPVDFGDFGDFGEFGVCFRFLYKTDGGSNGPILVPISRQHYLPDPVNQGNHVVYPPLFAKPHRFD